MVLMDEIRKEADYVFSSYSKLIKKFPPPAYSAGGVKMSEKDLVSLLKNGKEWAFEHTLKFQPRTAHQLLSGSSFELMAKFVTDSYVTYLVQAVNGQAVEICRSFLDDNPDDAGYRARIERINARLTKRWGYPRSTTERHLSLPEPIRMAYYHRIDGLNIPDFRTIGPFTRILPYPIGRPWQSIDGYLGDLRLKKKLLPVIEEMIPGVKHEDKDMPYINFMMFLNSWGSFIGKKRTDGDHLFVKNHMQDGVVYYIRDADVAGMTILADPGEAIDRYCEHVLLRKEERFDFRPWAVPFESPSA